MPGLNLAVFSLSWLRLEVAAKAGDAKCILALRRDANFTLATILWGNVAISVLLALLAEAGSRSCRRYRLSLLYRDYQIYRRNFAAGLFSRHALRVAAIPLPVLRLYQILLWPAAKPVGRMPGIWVGPEASVMARLSDAN